MALPCRHYAIEDLQAANVQILTSSHFVPKSIIGDPRLQGLIQRTNITRLEELFKNTQRIGFVIEYHTAQIILQKQLNFDHRTSRAYFVMMEERLSSDLVFFYLGKRNPTRARFAQLQQRVYESGMDLHCTRMFTASGSIQQTDLVEQPPKMIPFEQLWQLKWIFLCLWSCSLIVFMLEVSYLRVKKKVFDTIQQCKGAGRAQFPEPHTHTHTPPHHPPMLSVDAPAVAADANSHRLQSFPSSTSGAASAAISENRFPVDLPAPDLGTGSGGDHSCSSSDEDGATSFCEDINAASSRLVVFRTQPEVGAGVVDSEAAGESRRGMTTVAAVTAAANKAVAALMEYRQRQQQQQQQNNNVSKPTDWQGACVDSLK
ncbi:hypothetical protein quinque_004601 [Culex quinquefasciatus]